MTINLEVIEELLVNPDTLKADFAEVAYTTILVPLMFQNNPLKLYTGPIFNPVSHSLSSPLATFMDIAPLSLLRCPDTSIIVVSEYNDVAVRFLYIQQVPNGSPDYDFSPYGPDFSSLDTGNILPKLTASTSGTVVPGEYFIWYKVGIKNLEWPSE